MASTPREPRLDGDSAAAAANVEKHDQQVESTAPTESMEPTEATQTNQPPERSNLATRIRRMSKSFEESDLPKGFLVATGSFASSIVSSGRRPSLADRLGEMSPSSAGGGNSYVGDSADNSNSGSNAAGSKQQIAQAGMTSPAREVGLEAGLNPISDEGDDEGAGRGGPNATGQAVDVAGGGSGKLDRTNDGGNLLGRTDTAPFENGYHFPPSHGFAMSLKLGLRSFWAFFLTPVGFFVVVYGLLVVAFGGMLFLLLCNAAPAMCKPSCSDINSARRKWIEYDSQIVNALFCVTGFGLAPWRFRDLYFLMQYRLAGKQSGLQKLAGIHRGWFRLPGSQKLDKSIGPDKAEQAAMDAEALRCVPLPIKAMPDAPLTGRRASPTKIWKLDLVIWVYVGNTAMQCCLSAFMWGMNRYNRPSWAVGLFVGIAMVLAAVGGVQVFLEGKKVKGIEGVPLSDADRQRLALDKERGVSHYNNIKDKKPKPDKEE